MSPPLPRGASGVRVRGAAAGRQPGAAGPVPVVAARLRPPAQERERAQGQGRGGFPPRQLPRALQDPGEPPVLGAQPRQAAAALAQGALRGGREAARAAAGRRGQVPRAQEVPAAAHHLGRRGDELLLQGEVAGRAAGVVRAQPLPVPAREARAGRGHRPHHHAGQQLVQEPAPAGPGGRGQGEGEHGEQQRGAQQAGPAVAPGRREAAAVQLRGGLLAAAEPGPRLRAAPARRPGPRARRRLRPLAARPRPAGPPAAGLAAGPAHLQPRGPGLVGAAGPAAQTLGPAGPGAPRQRWEPRGSPESGAGRAGPGPRPQPAAPGRPRGGRGRPGAAAASLPADHGGRPRLLPSPRSRPRPRPRPRRPPPPAAAPGPDAPAPPRAAAAEGLPAAPPPPAPLPAP